MIKNLFTAIAVCSTLFATAQLGNKGQKIATANFSFNTNKSATTNPSNYTNSNLGASTSISLGKFTKVDQIQQFGISAYISNSKNNHPNNDFLKQNYKSFTGFYSILKLKSLHKNWYWGLIQQPSVSYSNNKGENNIAPRTTNDKTYGINYSVLPALYYSLNKKIALNVTLNNLIGVGASYSIRETKLSGLAYTDKNWNVGINAGFWNTPLQNINIGINYIW